MCWVCALLLLGICTHCTVFRSTNENSGKAGLSSLCSPLLSHSNETSAGSFLAQFTLVQSSVCVWGGGGRRGKGTIEQRSFCIFFFFFAGHEAWGLADRQRSTSRKCLQYACRDFFLLVVSLILRPRK